MRGDHKDSSTQTQARLNPDLPPYRTTSDHETLVAPSSGLALERTDALLALPDGFNDLVPPLNVDADTKEDLDELTKDVESLPPDLLNAATLSMILEKIGRMKNLRLSSLEVQHHMRSITYAASIRRKLLKMRQEMRLRMADIERSLAELGVEPPHVDEDAHDAPRMSLIDKRGHDDLKDQDAEIAFGRKVGYR